MDAQKHMFRLRVLGTRNLRARDLGRGQKRGWTRAVIADRRQIPFRALLSFLGLPRLQTHPFFQSPQVGIRCFQHVLERMN